MAGQLYTSVYDEQWGGWDRPQITVDDGDTLDHSSAPGNATCIPQEYDWVNDQVVTTGNCSSEYWSSMARYGRLDSCFSLDGIPKGSPVIDIMYVNDQAPGGCVQPSSGVWALNPVQWYVDSCRQAIPEPGFSVSPSRIGICYTTEIVVLDSSDTQDLLLTLSNPGLIDNTPVSVTPVYDSGGLGGGATTVTAAPNSGITIPKLGGEVPVVLTITTTNEQDFTTVFYTIEISHQAGANPPTIAEVPLCITVANDYIPLEADTIATTCKNLRIYNNGQMSNDGDNVSLDYTTDPDNCNDIYLYDGSKIVCREAVLPGDDSTMCWFSIFGTYYGNQRAIVQASPLFVDDASFTDYTYASTEMMTADSSIGLIVEYYAPKTDCEYMLIKQKMFNRTEVTLTGVAWGDALDWDIYGYHPNNNRFTEVNHNFGDFDAAKYLVWQTNNKGGEGCDPAQADACDTLSTTDRSGGIAAAQNTGAAQDGAGFKNYLVLENDTWVYGTGDSAQAGNPYPPSLMYNLMTTTDGFYNEFDPVADDSGEIHGEDLNMVVTIGVVDLAPGDTVCAVKIVTTSKDDPGQTLLKGYVDQANTFVANHDEIKCALQTECDCVPGDPNADGDFNVGDAVYLINYVFKGGAAPVPYVICSGDPNKDCQVNVGDAVYMINYVFKGGPAPATCEFWRDEGGAEGTGCGPLQ